MIKLMKSYKLLLILSLIIVFLTCVLITLSTQADIAEQKTSELRTQAEKYQVSAIKIKLSNLDKTIAQMNVPYPDKKEAKKILIAMAEVLRTMYGATMDRDVADADSTLSAKMSFTVLPAGPEQLTQLTDYLASSKAPLIKVEKMEFASLQGIKSVKFTITLSQPYTGGHYVY